MKKNITSKYLRENLQSIIRSVQEKGAEYEVYYRSTPAFKISPPKQVEKHFTLDEVNKILDSIKGNEIDWSKKGDPKFDAIMKKHGKNIPRH